MTIWSFRYILSERFMVHKLNLTWLTYRTISRLKQLLRHNGITKVDYTWSINNATKPWCLGDDTVAALKKERIAEVTFPLSESHQAGKKI